MHRAGFTLWLRSLVAALLAISLVAAPAIAAAEQPGDHTEFAGAHAISAFETAGEAHADHEHGEDGACHEAHGCGSCHFHWMGASPALSLRNDRVAPAAATAKTEPLIYLATAGPFRPPRG